MYSELLKSLALFETGSAVSAGTRLAVAFWAIFIFICYLGLRPSAREFKCKFPIHFTYSISLNIY